MRIPTIKWRFSQALTKHDLFFIDYFSSMTRVYAGPESVSQLTGIPRERDGGKEELHSQSITDEKAK